MRKSLPFIVAGCLLAIAACGQSDAQQGEPESNGASPDVTFERAFANLTFERPLYLLAGPETDERRLYVVQQAGYVTSFPNQSDVTAAQTRQVIDLTDQVRSPLGASARRGGNEEGLLGMAFHPDFNENRHVYLHYSAADNPRRNILSEWTMRRDGTIDPQSERVVMEVDQPYGNHNGGHIAFGPDGFLYITLGDGGAGGDPKNSGQDKSTLLGSILRIDVNTREDGKAYGIPDDNPFVNESNARPEIYAYGLRNVWRFSFDAKTGALWAGDVGQNAYEEIDIIEKGGNYGWNIREGMHDFRPRGRTDRDLIEPIHEYSRDIGRSVTGGYVYRGDDIPALRGAYIFADYVTGRVWSLRYEEGEVTQHRQIDRVPRPASFGVDHEGEIYACCFQGDDGHIRKLVAE